LVLEKYINLSTKVFRDGMATYEEQVRLYPLADLSSATVEELDRDIEQNPNDAELYLKKGIALSRATLHHQEAINVFSQGIQLDPFNAMLYRWRGHKHLNVRQFNAGRADLELSSRLDPSNWDTWYHLGLGNYLVGDFARAEAAYRRCWDLTDSDDKRVAIADWLYMTLMRQGRREEALGILDFVTPDVDAGPNDAYFRRLLMYKGFESPEALLADADKSDVNYVTLGYGLGNHFYCAGDVERAAEIWKTVLEGSYWSAFGYIASEVELRRLEQEAE
jgi:tetratricopeptide (TPR) repeat protein